MSVKFQTRVKITQIPSIQKKEFLIDPDTGTKVEIERSWLRDFFNDPFKVYGLEITLEDYFSWIFFFNEDSKSEAIRKGNAMLLSLKSWHPGLEGVVEVVPIGSEDLAKKIKFFELHFPRHVYKNKILLINKIIDLFYENSSHLIKLYIMWQKDDTSSSGYYKIKIFVTGELNYDPGKDRKKQKNELEGMLDFLEMDILNLTGETAYRYEAPRETWENILEGKIFEINSNKEVTGSCSSNISKGIPDHLMPNLTSPNQIDFDFPSKIPLQKGYSPRIENKSFLTNSKGNKSRILIGYHIHNGAKTNRKVYLPIDHFSQSVLICGQPGVGKSSLIGQISKEFYNKAPHIGILSLSLVKGKQEGFYKSDIVLSFGSLDFCVPYFVQGDYLEKSLYETATYLTASLGLGEPVNKILFLVMKSFIRTNGSMPRSLRDLFVGLRKWYITYPYYKKYQAMILRALKNRVLSLLADPIIDKTVEYTSKIPNWFHDWRAGKKILIDLSGCHIDVKRLLANAIFQMVRTLVPDEEASNLQNLIIIDEAHEILGKPTTRNHENDDFIAREQLEKIFTVLAREYRSKGISFIIAIQTPEELFDSTVTLPSLKMLFRLGYPSDKLFSNNQEEQDFLRLQKKRQLLVLNGINAETYAIKTTNYSYQYDVDHKNEEINISCTYCRNLVDYNARFCSICGKPVSSK